MEDKTAADVIWDLGDLYSSSADPQIQVDVKRLREQVSAFSSYRGKVAALGPEQLLQAILEMEEIEELTQKLLAYAYLNFSTNMPDACSRRSLSVHDGAPQ